MTDRSVVHSTFTIERTYNVSASSVFSAFADQETKRRWFVEGEGWQIHEYHNDFRTGGREGARFQFRGGPEIVNDTLYQNIVHDRRIVFSYTMTVAGNCISASLSTVELMQENGGTRLVYTEQGAYFDGRDGPKQRKQGWGKLLAALTNELGG
jgi:uncharacterized protein YndB with AHSA1/START domain